MSGDSHEVGIGSPDIRAADVADASDWQNRPPYRSDGSFEKHHTAHCHCGRVTYWLSRDRPLAAKFCHCVDCQALHGAPFQWAAIFHKSDVHFAPGAAARLAFYHAPGKSAEHKLPAKVSCAHCGAPIMDEGRNMALVFPGIIRFGSAEVRRLFDPQCHIFYSQRVVDLPDGKPKWSGLDNKSRLMTDEEAHAVQTVVSEGKVETTE